MIDLDAYIERFQQNASAIERLASGVTLEQARWKPAPDQWSFLEVINHLYDEEREDFRIRLEYTLYRPESDWPPNDPQGNITQRNYNERELASSLQNFLTERQASIAWLQTLENPDLSIQKRHPEFPPMSAGDLLASWLAHDFLHLRQLSELHWQYITHQAMPYSTDYAGEW